jgi:hypothetical protein
MLIAKQKVINKYLQSPRLINQPVLSIKKIRQDKLKPLPETQAKGWHRFLNKVLATR